MFRQTIILLLVITIFSSHFVFGQEKPKEDILKQLKVEKADLKKSALYIDLSKHEASNFEEAIKYGEQALRFAKASNSNLQIAAANYQLASVYTINGQPTDALPFYLKSHEYYELVPNDKGIIQSSIQIGNAYLRLGQTQNAKEPLTKGLTLAQQTNNYKAITRAYNLFTIYYIFANQNEKALQSAEKSYQIALDNNLDVSNALDMLGNIHRTLGNYDKSKKYYSLAWAQISDSTSFSSKIVRVEHMGTIYQLTGQYDSAMTYFFEYLELAQTANNEVYEAKARSFIAGLQFSLKELDKVKENLTKSMLIFEKNNMTKDYLNNLILLIKIKRTKGELQEARLSADKALELAQELDIKSLYAQIYFELGILNLEDKNLLLSQQNFQQALEYAEITKDKNLLGRAYYYLASIAFKNEKYDNAYNYAQKSISYLEMANYRQILGYSYKLLSKVASINQDFQSAYTFEKRYHSIKDSLLDEDKNNYLSKLQTEYAVKEKESENKALKAEQTKNNAMLRQRTILGIALFIVLGLISTIALILRRNNQLKNQQNQQLEVAIKKRTQELIETNRELEKIRHIKLLEKAKSRFFANVSHEFRTPLTLIQGPIEATLQSKTLAPQYQNLLKNALRNSKQLLNLVSEILDLTKLDTNQLSLNESSGVLYLLVRRIVANFESHAQRKSIQLKFHYLPQSDLQIEIDKDKFENILNNFISNALKFTPKGGTITITVSDLKNRLQIAVQDNGKGIPKEELEKVFNRYYQIPNQKDQAPLGEISNYQAGTGIGLALCKEYAKLFEGKVWAESPNGDGDGSTFYFQFPKKEFFAPLSDFSAHFIQQKEPILLEHDIQEISPSPVSNSSETIMIVEDNYDLRQFLQSLLEVEYIVITAEHGQDALDQLEKLTKLPALIISDVMMPIMNGFNFLEKIKSKDKFRHLPVMMLTARAEVKDKLKALRIGVDDYMLKPFLIEELKVRVHNLILNNHSRKETLLLEKDLKDEKEFILEKQVEVAISREDTEWLIQLEEAVQQLSNDFNFTSDKLAQALFVSRTQLFRKVKRLTGLTVNQYINEVRLQKARYLLEHKKVNSVKEIALSVGFKHANYFSQNYLKRFGKRPAEYFN